MKKKQKLNIREMILAAEAKTVMVNSSGRSDSLNTYSVDPEWDSVDNVDINDLLR